MKDKLKNIIQRIKLLRPLYLVMISVLVLSLVAVGIFVFSFANKTESTKIVSEKLTERVNLLADISSVVAIVGIDDFVGADGNSVSNNSWPGEIISSEISQIQPQREGVIKNWRVRIGDKVLTGQVLGEISAPPATPELIAMLAEKAEGLARAKAQAIVADKFAAKEQLRFNALNDSIDGKIVSGTDLSLTALEGMRKLAEVKRAALRSFIERALSRHIAAISNTTDWRYFRSTAYLNPQYGLLNSNIQNAFRMSLLGLVEKLNGSDELPIESAQNYFALATQLANNSVDSGGDMAVSGFKMTAAEDQKDFLEMLTDYREAQADLADKETDYKIMINENSSMVEKERSMAHAEVAAMEASYKTVANEITGGLYIIAPNTGVVSAIYKKVGDLVNPGMSIAVIAGQGKGDLIVRITIPNNVRRPSIGEVLSVVRPGFPMNIHKVKITGIGGLLDEMGAYMADAIFIDGVDWPVGSSVRIIASENSNSPVIKLSAVWWSEDGAPQIWEVSEAGRIFARKITIGRTLGTAAGTSVEIYEGIKNGDRYIISPTKDIQENMLIDEIVSKEGGADGSAESGEQDSMAGMGMY
ncbi:MAG: hypothetical protein Q7S81_00975 [bacterium]|nr:hypothetical protein [bacterium]